MTEKTYEVKLNLKSPFGWITFGCFQLGNQKSEAELTFKSLAGQPGAHNLALKLELVEHNAATALFLESKECTLDEISENARLLTRDAFKYFTLE